MVVAAALHFYLARRGGGGGDGGPISGAGLHSPDKGTNDITVVSSSPHLPTQLFDASPTNNSNGIDGGNLGHGSSNSNHSISSIIVKVTEVIHNAVAFPSLLVGSVRNSVGSIIAFPSYLSEKCSSGWEWSYGKLLHGVISIVNIPANLGSSAKGLASSLSVWVSNKVSAMFFSCRTGVFQTVIAFAKNVPSYITDCWSNLLLVVSEYFLRMKGNNASPINP